MSENNLKVYIVEPDPLFSMVLYRTLLEIKGITHLNMFIFNDGDDFLRHYDFQDEHSIYIINDILPKQSGTQLIKTIREHDDRGFVYIMSKSNTAHELEFAINMGADNFFVKPFNLDVFKAVIKRKVERRHLAWN